MGLCRENGDQVRMSGPHHPASGCPLSAPPGRRTCAAETVFRASRSGVISPFSATRRSNEEALDLAKSGGCSASAYALPFRGPRRPGAGQPGPGWVNHGRDHLEDHGLVLLGRGLVHRSASVECRAISKRPVRRRHRGRLGPPVPRHGTSSLPSPVTSHLTKPGSWPTRKSRGASMLSPARSRSRRGAPSRAGTLSPPTIG